VIAREIRGVAVSSALPSMVLVDQAGDPLANAYNLMDKRAVEIVQDLKDKIGEERIFDISKNRLDDHPSSISCGKRNIVPRCFQKSTRHSPSMDLSR
jgi:xylulokinase